MALRLRIFAAVHEQRIGLVATTARSGVCWRRRRNAQAGASRMQRQHALSERPSPDRRGEPTVSAPRSRGVGRRTPGARPRQNIARAKTSSPATRSMTIIGFESAALAHASKEKFRADFRALADAPKRASS